MLLSQAGRWKKAIDWSEKAITVLSLKVGACLMKPGLRHFGKVFEVARDPSRSSIVQFAVPSTSPAVRTIKHIAEMLGDPLHRDWTVLG